MFAVVSHFLSKIVIIRTFSSTDCLYNGLPYAIGALSCLSVLSVTLVYCGQTVGWIKMKLGMQVGLSPDHIILNGDPPPPPKGHSSPIFGLYL